MPGIKFAFEKEGQGASCFKEDLESCSSWLGLCLFHIDSLLFIPIPTHMEPL